ncbi:thioesterase [Rugosibacter aromaticivorans]|uniref:Thioesterase n=2 Tax=Rugosibacter aromaticivorans TaxID=1565605 RepID=A0A0C5IYC5_9PROT|nr:thioesterase [Rugosibacter aromaticivorans]TAJ18524.1 MAG: acyl-CoA thioesterase [Rugosibacter sp.]TBR13170.1 MAG: acyl-CoA thioesterase [Rugosibacter sp.]
MLGRKLVYRHEMPLRWGDQDAMNHINNTLYFRYMEQARVEWLDALCAEERREKNQGVVLVNASCTFLIPLTYPGEVSCDIFIGQPGRSSLPTFYELRRLDDHRLYAEGAAKLVWIDKLSGKSMPLPDALRLAFADAQKT